ncbi:DUF1206 domain-containing protein [uncultured Roseobacter sp.]|uniref:DUF1206 domain-containing protein n=1 Tax=uncultured Roseobacter sp. TaxID=114847 RepID=UPI0026083DA4|nr:DUF1206 domain-containing protein [uncultured Roseobacter sp.]
MSIADSLSIDSNSTRAKILEKVDPGDFRWAIPIMRAGYAGRALVYLVVAVFSLWSIASGGQAEGTKSVMETLRGKGMFVVVLIAAGMLAYAIWRLIDCVWDLEAYGTSAKGLIARAGMLVTGAVHAGIGVLALTALDLTSAGSGASGGMLASVMSQPLGLWLVGIAGVLTLGAAGYYGHKAISESYRDNLMANHFTRNWNSILKIGVLAQAAVMAIVGLLIVYAALLADPSQAGGLGAAFDWLRDQVYGRILVMALCVGLLAFAVFCAVNAAFRIVPKAADDSVESVSAYLSRN